MSLFGIIQQNGNFWVPGWVFYVSYVLWAVFLLIFVFALIIAALLMLDKRDIPGLVENEPEDDHLRHIENPEGAQKLKRTSRQRRKYAKN